MMLVSSLEDIKKDPTLNLVTKKDWQKIGRFLKREWPKPWPKYVVLDRMNWSTWVAENLQESTHVVFDVETKQIGPKQWSGEIIQIGLYPIGKVPAIWDREVYPSFPFDKVFREAIGEKIMIAQNAAFDVRRIRENFGITYWDYKDVDDTVLMHHILWSEFRHSLSFMLSIYSDYPRAKHLGVGNYDYLLGDIVGTAEVYLNLLDEFRQDPLSANLYYTTLKPLLPIIIETMDQGVRVNKEFIQECLDAFPSILEYARNLAEAYCGYPVSMDSGDQFRILLTEIEDVFDTAKKLSGEIIRKELTKTGAISLGKDTLDELRSAFLYVDFREELTPELVEKRLEKGAHPLLEAKALWNSTRVLMSNYITPLIDKGSHVGAGTPYDKRSVVLEETGGENDMESE